MQRYAFFILLILASKGIGFAGPGVSISGALEPAFYSTGDYQSYVRSLSLYYWPTRFLGISASAGEFEFLTDRVSWFTSIQVEVYDFRSAIRTGEWKRQRLEFELGFSRHHRHSDVTFLEVAAKDSVMIQKLQLLYMNAPHDSLEAKYTDFRMRTAVRDEDGYYRYGISRLRDYSLNGISSFLTYSVRLFGGVRAHISPGVRYYSSEPLFLWSVACGLNIPLLPE